MNSASTTTAKPSVPSSIPSAHPGAGLLSSRAFVAHRRVSAPCPASSDGTPANATGIHPGLGPQHEGLPFIQLSGGFTIGNNGEGELPQVGNSFQWSDNVSKVIGNHSFKFGGDVRRQRFDQTLYFDVSGEYFC